jgi:phage baseplate assembly protein W
MAIKLKTLERLAKTYTEQKYLYKDLALDLSKTIINTPGFLTSVPGNDIKTSFDKEAIRNSLQNLFNTLPGQRFLFPEYGLDLYQFLFLPVTQSTGEAIARKILQGVERFEPRVIVQRVNVQPLPDQNTYFITLILQLPAFKQLTTLQGELNIKSQSFIFLPTSRNQ